MRQTINLIFLFALGVTGSLPTGVLATTTDDVILLTDSQEVLRAVVTKIISEESRDIPGTDTETIFQTIEAETVGGKNPGKPLTLENDYLKLAVGEQFFLLHTIRSDGSETFVVSDPYRLPIIWWLLGLFAISIIALGGKQGFRSLASLAGSLLVIAYVLVPLLLKGYSPIFISSVVAAIILFIAIFATHGLNKESAIAFTGTMSAVILTTILAYFATTLANLSGFGSDEAVYLNFNTRGSLDFAGLLLGGIIIGTLGVLDDIAITQTAVVRELLHTDNSLTKKDIYRKALSVGREHVGALVNTLALAYTGASLPLVLLLSQSTMPALFLVNSEIFATEIIRTVVGSIGLILTVPITTALAVMYLSKNDPIKHGGHTHHH